ncbi:MAG TPA: hypothetical protein VFD43_00495 [Planctomycetota bacterium]|nr:hypothetical protein [Planctomycetota bacterium]
MTTRPGARLLPLLALALLAAPSPAQQPDWQVTAVPVDPGWWTAEFTDVSASGPDDVWAVGHFKTLGPQFQIETFTLAMHWDGAGWTQVPTPSPAPWPGGTKAYLNSVAALAPDDAWAGGERVGDAGGESIGPWIHVQHWDGDSWQVVPVPEPPGGVSINFSGTRVLDVVAFAPDEVWFGGQWAEPNELGSVTWRPLAMLWNGSDLELLPTPAPQDGAYGFKTVQLAGSSGDLWAVCARDDNGSTTKNVVLRWDGSAWSQASVPDTSPPHVLRSIAVAGPDDVWVFGDVPLQATAVALHYDGRSWTEVADPPFALSSQAVSPEAIWVGSNQLELFDGEQSVFVETFPGAPPQSVFAIAETPDGLWAVGRAQVPGMVPWAARLLDGPSPWATLPGGVAGAFGQPALAGQGPLLPGSLTSLALDGAAPGTATTLVVGVSELSAPFKGGLLVPSPHVLVPGLMADAGGSWTLSFAWPAGLPAGATLWFQAWTPDGAAPAGFAASDGLGATQP